MKVKLGMLRNHEHAIHSVQRLADIILIAATCPLLTLVYGRPWAPQVSTTILIAVLAFAVAAEVCSLYRPWRIERFRVEIRTVFLAWSLTVGVLILIGFATKTSEDYSRVISFAWFALAPVVLSAWRLFVRSILRGMRANGWNTRQVAILGATDNARHLCEQIAERPWMGIRIKGVFDDRGADRRVDLTDLECPFLGGCADLIAACRASEIDVVYVALPLRAEPRIAQVMHDLADTTATLYLVADFYQYQPVGAQLSSIGRVPLISLHGTPIDGVNSWLKRLEDIVLGSVILAMITPPMLVIAIMLKLTSRGPVFFAQRRYGLNGKEIRILKFRTMTVSEDGDKVVQAQKNDKRVTPLGAILRRNSLDELPQFLQVIAGQMSIVGPRPHAVAHNETYRTLIPGYMLRHKVKPGITGWAQVNGWRGETPEVDSMKRRVEHDLEYINRWTVLWDIKIVLLTIFGRKKNQNAYWPAARSPSAARPPPERAQGLQDPESREDRRQHARDPLDDELNGGRGEDEAHHALDDVHPRLPEPPLDGERTPEDQVGRVGRQRDGAEDHGILPGVLGARDEDHDRRRRARPREDGDGEREDRDVGAPHPLGLLLGRRALAGPLRAEHVDGQQEEENAARDPKGAQGDAEHAEDHAAEGRERREHDAGGEGRPARRAALVVGRVRGRHREEQRHRRGRVDDQQQRRQRRQREGHEAREHAAIMSPNSRVRRRDGATSRPRPHACSDLSRDQPRGGSRRGPPGRAATGRCSSMRRPASLPCS